MNLLIGDRGKQADAMTGKSEPPHGLLPVEAREPVSAEIARKLLDYLLSGVLLPGDRLPSERELSRTFGVGRSAVRDALKPLTLLGIIDVRQGDGTYLRATESELLPKAVEWGLLLGERRALDLVEARRHIEVALATLAAQRRSEEDLRELRKLLRQMEEARSDDEFIDADIAFHLRLAEAAGNSVLSGILTNIRSLIQVWITRVTYAAESVAPSYREHVPIMEAVEAKDPAAAAAAMAAHMDSAGAKLTRTLEAERATSAEGLREPKIEPSARRS
jgi:GntR family transcriptional regulator, transcriptional repressor for pyruvate dehydrogenase complex